MDYKISTITLKQCVIITIITLTFFIVIYNHGFDSGTISAIMDTITAGIAVIAAIGIKGWMKDKVKNKGFDIAEKILTSLIELHLETFKIIREYEAINDSILNSNKLENYKLVQIDKNLKSLHEKTDILKNNT